MNRVLSMGKYLPLALALLACTETTTDDEPFPGTPEALLENSRAKWAAVSKRSYSITYEELNVNGTTTISCQAKTGIIESCTKVVRCCDQKPDTSTLTDYASPADWLDELKTELGRIKPYNSIGDNKSFNVVVAEAVPAGNKPTGIKATFDLSVGILREITYEGVTPPRSMKVIEFELK